jgi:hypothetical protein
MKIQTNNLAIFVEEMMISIICYSVSFANMRIATLIVMSDYGVKQVSLNNSGIVIVVNKCFETEIGNTIRLKWSITDKNDER